MRHPRRFLTSFIGAALLASLALTPVSAARPGGSLPTFTVTPQNPVYGPAANAYLQFTFESMSRKAFRGSARLTLPTRAHHQWGSVGWVSPLQTDRPGEPGYVRVESSTCRSASIGTVVAGPTLTYGPRSVEAKVDCAPGQRFVVHLFTRVDFWGFAGNLDEDRWALPVDVRTAGAGSKWVSQAPAQEFRIPPMSVVLPPMPYITPPLQLTEVEDVSQPAEPIWRFEGAGYLELQGTKVASEIRVTDVYDAATGTKLVVADASLLRVGREIQVTSCVPGFEDVCTANDLDLVVGIVDPPPGAFKHFDGTPYVGSYAMFRVVFVETKPEEWPAAETRCKFHNGHLSVPDFPLEDAYVWACGLHPDVSLATFNAVSADLKQAVYCPTGRVLTDPLPVDNRFVVCAVNWVGQ